MICLASWVNRGVVTAVAFYILCKINGFAKPILFKTKPVFDFDLKEREEVNDGFAKPILFKTKPWLRIALQGGTRFYNVDHTLEQSTLLWIK